MIPKIIHYCWFGENELSDLAKKCVQSWKLYCPDYKIKEWNEKNFDINSNLYVKEAYLAKKWAFVSDYVRLYALLNEGGIYMDTDVQLLKSLDNFLELKAFGGIENNNKIQSSLIGSEKLHPWIKSLISYYDNKHFINKDGEYDLTPNVKYITDITRTKYNIILNNSLIQINDVINIYPMEFFSPKDSQTGRLYLTENTYAIHHFDGSWLSKDVYKKRERVKILSPYVGKFVARSLSSFIFYYKTTGIKGLFYKIKEKYFGHK